MKTLVRRMAWKVGVDLPPDERGPSGRIRFLETILPKGGVGAEVGVHKGHFTPVLREITRPATLHIIDPWYRLGREWNWGAGDRSTINALTRIIKRLEGPLADGSVVLHIGDDLEILPRLEPGTFDWMYFDTTHSYGQTCRELRLAETLIKPDGIICGDDWRDDPGHVHYGVHVAIEEFCAATDFAMVYSGAVDRQWAIRRRRAS